MARERKRRRRDGRGGSIRQNLVTRAGGRESLLLSSLMRRTAGATNAAVHY
jgi:hypothetical protein